MLRKIALTLAIAATAAVALVPTAAAASPQGADAIAGARCVQAGVRFLLENDLLVAAARQQIDYDAIDSDSGGSEGAINTTCPQVRSCRSAPSSGSTSPTRSSSTGAARSAAPSAAATAAADGSRSCGSAAPRTAPKTA